MYALSFVTYFPIASNTPPSEVHRVQLQKLVETDISNKPRWGKEHNACTITILYNKFLPFFLNVLYTTCSHILLYNSLKN